MVRVGRPLRLTIAASARQSISARAANFGCLVGKRRGISATVQKDVEKTGVLDRPRAMNAVSGPVELPAAYLLGKQRCPSLVAKANNVVDGLTTTIRTAPCTPQC